jgi:hypothetical protein
VHNYIYPLTVQVAYEVACDLRPDDRRECVEGHGLDPKIWLPISAKTGDNVYFKVPDGTLAGCAGVNDDGSIWMLCTPAVERFPVTFAREAKKYIESRKEKLLWNIADKRNTVHLKLLKFLGFKFLRELEYGPNNITFIEFCRGNRSYLSNSCNRQPS